MNVRYNSPSRPAETMFKTRVAEPTVTNVSRPDLASLYRFVGWVFWEFRRRGRVNGRELTETGLICVILSWTFSPRTRGVPTPPPESLVRYNTERVERTYHLGTLPHEGYFLRYPRAPHIPWWPWGTAVVDWIQLDKPKYPRSCFLFLWDSSWALGSMET